MRATKQILTLASVIGLSFLLSACGDNVSKKVSCTDSKSCVSKSSSLFIDGGDPALWPVCCGGFCILPSAGCDSGERYMTSGPTYGECTEMPLCASTDMAMPQPTVDMSSSD
jgi:hypothetical protein